MRHHRQISQIRRPGAADADALMSGGPLGELVGLAGADLGGIIAGLARSDTTVAAAESLTGGLLTAVLTEVPGASAVIRGGVVVYATDLKHSLAGVDSVLLAARGPVDPDVALELARGARVACGAKVGLGLTGVAGPDPQNGVEVGTWYVAISGDTTSKVVSHLTDQRPWDAPPAELRPPSRGDVRNAAVRAAVRLLAELVESAESAGSER